MTDWGLVVIGGGLSGLSTALTWATHGPDEPVLLLEAGPRCCGAVTSWQRRGYTFEATQLTPDPGLLLEAWGVEVELARTPRLARIFSPDAESLELPVGWEALEAALAERQPQDGPGLARLFREARLTWEELHRCPLDPGVIDIARMLFSCQRLVRWGGVTWERWLRRFGPLHPETRRALDLFAEFGGLPADRLAAMVPLAALGSLMEGVARPVGEFEALPRAMEARLAELGGVVRTRARVEQVEVDAQGVSAVLLEGGERIPCRRVVGAMDARVLLEELVGAEVLEARAPALARRLGSLEMSPSSLAVNLGLSDAAELSSLDCAYGVLHTSDPRWPRLGVVAPHLLAGGRPWLSIRAYPVEGEPWIRLRATDRDAYRSRKRQVADELEALVARHLLPELPELVAVRDVNTPATFARYLGSTGGSVYGMASTVHNAGRTRLPLRTGLPGLWLASFVHGIFPALQHGFQVVDQITDGQVMGGRALLSA